MMEKKERKGKRKKRKKRKAQVDGTEKKRTEE